MPVAYLKETPSQTGGPFVHIGMLPGAAGIDMDLSKFGSRIEGDGERIVVEGLITDGAGAPVKDAVVEIWQADADGRHNSAGFLGFARASADQDTGVWRIETIRPGPTKTFDGRAQAPHISLLMFARGINIHLHTRMYFAEEGDANAADPVLGQVQPPSRRATLIAPRTERDGVGHYRFDIRLQGDHETVFFDV